MVKRKRLARPVKVRKVWKRNPATKVVESKKQYRRARMKQETRKTIERLIQ